MREVAVPGRLAWRISGLVTAAALAIPATWLVAQAGVPVARIQQDISASRYARTRDPGLGGGHTVTITQPVTSVNVHSYGAGARILVMTGSGGHDVTVTEAISYSGQRPAVTAAVSHGKLTLDAPACASSDCSVSFAVTVPARVPVTAVSTGGEIIVAGAAGANLTSGGGAVEAVGIDGPLMTSTAGGSLTVTGLTGALNAETGGGPLFAQGVAAATATVTTAGGDVQLGFVTAPDSVRVGTGGGAADVVVPWGTYALTANSGGGPQSVGIATDPSAARSISVRTSGGALWIGPAGAAGAPGFPVAPAPPLPPLPPLP